MQGQLGNAKSASQVHALIEAEMEVTRPSWGHGHVARMAAIVVAGCMALAFASLMRHSHRANDPADALLERADNLAWKNKWMEAAPEYATAETLFREQNRPSKALYAQVSQFIPRAESEDLSTLLIDLQHDLSLPAARDPETKLRILTIQGIIATNYDASMARDIWQSVEAQAEHQHQYQLMMRAMGEQGIADFLLGDVADARKLVVRAWLTAKYFGDPAAEVRYESAYGTGMVALHRYNEAIAVLDKAIHTAQSDGLAYPSIAVSSKADALRGLHRYQEALDLVNSVIQRLPQSPLDAHLFQLFTSKGQIYEEMERWSDAELQYRLALDYARYLHYWRGITQTGGLLAHVYEEEGELPNGLASINEAIAANRHLPTELYFVPGNLATRAEILQQLGRRQEAELEYEKGAVLVDSLIATAPTPNVEAELLTQMQTVYSGEFELFVREKRYAAALKAVEEVRGRIVAQALEHHIAAPLHLPTPEEQHITQLNLSLIDSQNDTVHKKIAEELYEAELKMDDPSLSQWTATHPVALKALQRTLDPTECLIEYVLADPHSYVMVITRHSVDVYSLRGRSIIEDEASRYRSLLREHRSAPLLAQSLFNDLLAPVKEYQREKSIIVIRDGDLHLLPFSALTDHGVFTIVSHCFSAVPSATVLYILRRSNQSRSYAKTYLAVATTPYGFIDHHRTPASESELAALGPLPESVPEAEAVSRLLPPPGIVLIGSQATETAFKHLPLEQFEIIHLSIHGYADLEFPDRSALVFASESGGIDDGLLEVREVRGLHLRARLVTLSACDAGVGPISESGVADLVNAFLEAGAQSVVSTLWGIDDTVTNHLMKDFYSRLAGGQNESDALREAQLDLLQAGLPPYYWAGFELVGNGNSSL